MNKVIENNESEGNTSNSENDNINEKKTRNRLTKKQQFTDERKEIIKEIYEVLRITEENKTILLYEIEKSIELKKKVNELDEKIKKYFKTGNWHYYIQKNNGEISPMIGLIRAILKDNDIELTKKDISLVIDGSRIRTTKYYLN